MEDNKEAVKLNQTLEEKAPQIFYLLSEKGKRLYFPKAGILSQSAQAKGKRLNATIGVALDEEGAPLTLDSIMRNVKLRPEETVSYASSYGVQELREEWLQRIKGNNPDLRTRTSLPVCTNGITHALSLASELFVEPGERVIIPEPMWGNYRLVFQGANIDTFPIFKESGYNLEDLEKKLKKSKGKQIVVLNFPHNPTGYSPTEKEVDEIARILEKSAQRGNKLVVLCDDAYFGLFYEDDVYPQSVFSKLADLHENVFAVKLDGVTKEMYSWGLRVGFVTYTFKGMDREAAQTLEDKTAGAVRGNISKVPTPSQYLALKALRNGKLQEEERENREVLKRRYEEVKSILEKDRYSDNFEPLPFNSGYFLCVEMKTKNAEEVRKKLLEDWDTGVIAIDEHLLRVAFSSVAKEDLEELFENLYKACEDLD